MTDSTPPGALTGAVEFLEALAAGRVTQESECASASMAWDVVREHDAEIERLRVFVQFVADCSNDPGVRTEAIKMGAKP